MRSYQDDLIGQIAPQPEDLEHHLINGHRHDRKVVAAMGAQEGVERDAAPLQDEVPLVEEERLAAAVVEERRGGQRAHPGQREAGVASGHLRPRSRAEVRR